MTARAAALLEVLWGRASTAPVSASQLRVLFILEHDEGINPRTLADALASTPPWTSPLTSRREPQLHLSRHGRAFLTDLRLRRETTLRSVLERVPADRRTSLLDGLEAFCAAAAAAIHEDESSAARTA